MLNYKPSKHLLILLVLFALWIPVAAEEEGITQEDINDALGGIVPTNPFEMMRQLSQPQNSPVQELTPEMIEEMPDLFVETVMLKFLRAKNVKPALQNLVAPYGNISTDEDTNTLIIAGTREQVDRVLEQVRKADQTPKQIMIDVVILDVVLEDDTEMGVDWDTTSLFGGLDNIQTYGHDLTTLTSGASFSLFRSGIDITVKALQEKKDVEILSSPRIMVLSGQTATIKTVEEIPYEESSETSEGGSLTSISFKEAGIALEVSPVITDEGKIILNVKPSQSVKTGEYGQAGDSADIPIVDKREVDTTLILEDGQTVVIGGLRKKHETVSSDSVPIFGDIPIIGNLFRNDSTDIVNSELLVMLCPKIYKDSERLSEFEHQKYNELKQAPHIEFEAKQPQMKEDLEFLGKSIFSIFTGEK